MVSQRPGGTRKQQLHVCSVKAHMNGSIGWHSVHINYVDYGTQLLKFCFRGLTYVGSFCLQTRCNRFRISAACMREFRGLRCASLYEGIVHSRDEPIDDPAAARCYRDDKQIERREAALQQATVGILLISTETKGRFLKDPSRRTTAMGVGQISRGHNIRAKAGIRRDRDTSKTPDERSSSWQCRGTLVWMPIAHHICTVHGTARNMPLRADKTS